MRRQAAHRLRPHGRPGHCRRGSTRRSARGERRAAVEALARVLGALAVPYADHPDYRRSGCPDAPLEPAAVMRPAYPSPCGGPSAGSALAERDLLAGADQVRAGAHLGRARRCGEAPGGGSCGGGGARRRAPRCRRSRGCPDLPQVGAVDAAATRPRGPRRRSAPRWRARSAAAPAAWPPGARAGARPERGRQAGTGDGGRQPPAAQLDGHLLGEGAGGPWLVRRGSSRTTTRTGGPRRRAPAGGRPARPGRPVRAPGAACCRGGCASRSWPRPAPGAADVVLAVEAGVQPAADDGGGERRAKSPATRPSPSSDAATGETGPGGHGRGVGDGEGDRGGRPTAGVSSSSTTSANSLGDGVGDRCGLAPGPRR